MVSRDYHAFAARGTLVSRDYPCSLGSRPPVSRDYPCSLGSRPPVSRDYPCSLGSRLPILVVTAIGFGLGQGWDFLGLPSLRMGEANVLPAAAFALLLQPLARFVPLPNREPKEPAEGDSNSRI